MWKEKVGGLPIELYTYQQKGEIVPSLKGATRSRIDRRMRILEADEIFKTNIRLDSYYNEFLRKNDVSLSVEYNENSPWSNLKKDIKGGYLTLAQLHKTHSGRYPTVKPLFNFLLYKYLPEYPECEQRINPIVSEVDASENAAWRILNPDKYKNDKKILSKHKNIFRVPYVQDLSIAYVLTAYDKWENSFTIFDRSLSETDRGKSMLRAFWLLEFLRRIMWTKGNALRERVAEEGLTDKKGIYPCLVIYAIHSLERDANKKILKTEKVLSEIWDLPFSTFKDRMSELLSLDS